MLVLNLGCGITAYGDVNLDVDKERYWRQWKEMRGQNWILADAHRLPFRDEVFDRVLAGVSLPYMKDERKVVREVHRVLKNGTFTISHHLLPFYVKYVIRYSQERITHGRKFILYPYYRIIDLLLKILTYLFNDNCALQFWKMSALTTPRRMRSLLKQEGFKVTSLSVRDPWCGFCQFIDVKCLKEG